MSGRDDAVTIQKAVGRRAGLVGGGSDNERLTDGLLPPAALLQDPLLVSFGIDDARKGIVKTLNQVSDQLKDIVAEEKEKTRLLG